MLRSSLLAQTYFFSSFARNTVYSVDSLRVLWCRSCLIHCLYYSLNKFTWIRQPPPSSFNSLFPWSFCDLFSHHSCTSMYSLSHPVHSFPLRHSSSFFIHDPPVVSPLASPLPDNSHPQCLHPHHHHFYWLFSFSSFLHSSQVPDWYPKMS